MLALVIDDSRAMRRMLSRFLVSLGFDVEEAENGRDALDRLGQIETPQLMLVDWNMPEMNGLEFVQALRQLPDYASSKTMMVTTETGIDRVGKALEAGANEYLMKPFTEAALREKIEGLGLSPKPAPKAEPSCSEPDLKVLIVDDSSVVRRLVCRALDAEPGLTTATAENGQDGIDKIEEWSPDAVVLDIEMPVLDGLSALKEIRQRHRRLPVIMFSTLTERGASVTLQALASGASAYVTKPTGAADLTSAMSELRSTLASQIKALCKRPKTAEIAALDAERRNRPIKTTPAGKPVDAIVIASSTGGPNALGALIPALPADLPVPILMVQHMPTLFTSLLAKSLDQKSQVTVREAAAGDAVEPGVALLAPGGLHMEIQRNGDVVSIVTHDAPPEQSVRPAADVLFRSAAKVYGANILAIVLTGMGRDGKNGCDAISAAGGQIIVQDEDSSVVWGMPGIVVRADLADAELPLDQIASEIVTRLSASAAGTKPV